MSASATVNKPGDPDAWLGFGRWTSELEEVTPQEVEAAGLHGPLRGIDYIDLDVLRTAMGCEVTAIENGFYVFDPHSRNTKEGKSSGWEVNLDDRDMERCYCHAFVYRFDNSDTFGDTKKPSTVCKHILAACLHHPKYANQLAPFVAQVTQRQSIAAAVKKPVVEDDA